MKRHEHVCPWCGETFYGHGNKRFCRRSHAEMYNRKFSEGRSPRHPKPNTVTQAMVRKEYPKPVRRTMYRRGTKDMPKCKHKSCWNHLYWPCELKWGECIHCHQKARRITQPQKLPSIPSASIVQAHV